jgi:hypothetical protein
MAVQRWLAADACGYNASELAYTSSLAPKLAWTHLPPPLRDTPSRTAQTSASAFTLTAEKDHQVRNSRVLC